MELARPICLDKGCSDDEDRYERAPEHSLSNAADVKTRQALPPVRSHYDKIDLRVGANEQQLVDRLSVQETGLARDFMRFCATSGPIEQLSPECIEIANFPARIDVDRTYDVCQSRLRAIFVC